MPDKDPGINRFSREERAKLLHIKNGYSTRLRTGSVLYPCHYGLDCGDNMRFNNIPVFQ